MKKLIKKLFRPIWRAYARRIRDIANGAANNALLGIHEDLNRLNSKFDYLLDTKQPYHAIERIVAASILHPISFGGYKNKYEGRDVVICGAGATLNYYEPHKDAIFIGVNRAFLSDKIKFDYIFSQDFNGVKHIQDEFIEYKGNDCKKFLAYQNDMFSEFPEYFIDKCHAIRFYTDVGIRFHSDWVKDIATSRYALDIEHFPIGNFYSSVFAPLQFALYTHPKRIFIVGVDLWGGHFDDATGKPEGKQDAPDTWHNKDGGLSLEMQQQWQSFKDFAALHYPDTEIISVNPVGLKGFFKDEYTEAYLKAQKEKEEKIK